MLPGNLHYTEPNPNSESLKAGILKVLICAYFFPKLQSASSFSDPYCTFKARVIRKYAL